MKNAALLVLLFYVLTQTNLFSQEKPNVIIEQNSIQTAGSYSGEIKQASPEEQGYSTRNTTILEKINIKCLSTVTEMTGNTAGRIWVAAGFQGAGSSSTPDSIRILYSSDNGSTWVLYASIALGGTDKINLNDMDAELIEGGTNKFLHLVYGLRSGGGTGKWFAAGASIQLTGTFNANLWTFNWPGTDSTKRYYSPKITSDNYVWPTSPWVYVAVSFDSASATGRVNTQKFAQLNSPNSITPNFMYKPGKIYWAFESASQQQLYTDIAFFQRNNIDSLIISYSGAGDSTKVFFSKMSASGGLVSPVNPGQYAGPISGAEPNAYKYGGKLSTNGNNNGSVVFVFRQKLGSADGIKYFTTTNYGDFNSMNESTFMTNASGVTMPDITGIRGSSTHRLVFGFKNPAADSLKYMSLRADGVLVTNSNRINSGMQISGMISPAAGMRNVNNDSCFAVFAGSGENYVHGGAGCSGTITSIGSNETIQKYELLQNYPNPFNPVTRISFTLPASGIVTLKIYDVTGKEVSVLINETKNAGKYSIDFNADALSSGVYFYKLEAGNAALTKKMILLR